MLSTAPSLEQALLGSTTSQVLVLVDDEEHVSVNVAGGGSTVWQVAISVVNVFVGLGLLSMPYALKLSGWCGVPVLILVLLLFAISGKIFVSCFDALPPNIPHTYPDLGRYVFKSETGRYVVLGLTILELFGSSCMCLIILWRQVELLLPEQGVGSLDGLSVAVIGSCVATLPLLCLPSLRSLSMLSTVGFTSTAMATLLVDMLLPLDPHRTGVAHKASPDYSVFHLGGLFQAIGIFAVSSSGHTTFPAMRASLKKPDTFGHVIQIAFTTMAIVYGSVGSIGYFYFGNSVDTLITRSLAQDSIYAGRRILGEWGIDSLLQLLIAIRSYTSFPILTMVMQDMLMSTNPELYRHGWRRMPPHGAVVTVRMGVFALVFTASYFARHVLGNLISLVGGLCSITCSLLLPTVFLLVLTKSRANLAQRAALSSLVVLAALMIVLVTGNNIMSLIQGHHNKGDGMAHFLR